MSAGRPLGADDLRVLFRQLSDELTRVHAAVDLYVVGGAAIAFTVDLARTTRDVDAVLFPREDAESATIRLAAARVGRANGLTDDWLNDGAKGFVPAGTDADLDPVFQTEYLRVYAASAPRLLAMKVDAGRGTDREDLVLLADHLGLSDAEAVLDVAERELGRPLAVRSQYFVQEVMATRISPGGYTLPRPPSAGRWLGHAPTAPSTPSGLEPPAL